MIFQMSKFRKRFIDRDEISAQIFIDRSNAHCTIFISAYLLLFNDFNKLEIDYSLHSENFISNRLYFSKLNSTICFNN